MSGKKSLWTICYTLLLIAFTAYVTFDALITIENSSERSQEQAAAQNASAQISINQYIEKIKTATQEDFKLRQRYNHCSHKINQVR